jgi:hypothetical protein
VVGGTITARQWLRTGVPITGATGTTYTLAAEDQGENISYRQTATGGGGEATATSAATIPIQAPPLGDQEYFGSAMFPFENGRTNDALKDAQKDTAQELKANQEETAKNLKVEQTRRSAFLKDAQNMIATSLALFQQKSAITLVERQMIKAIRKKNAELDSANNSGTLPSQPENERT